jgi:hypothetical protein
MILSFTSTSNRAIDIESLYCQRTYQGVGVGDPDEEMNQDVVTGITRRAQMLWPGTPVAVVNGHGQDVLPRICIAAMAYSTQPVHDADMHGSQLVLVWFTEVLPFGTELPGISDLQAFSWEAHAQDFMW